MANFSRKLGNQSGVQLNPLIDNSAIQTNGGFSDQNVAAIARTTRGRYDKPFLVNQANIAGLLGRGTRLSQGALNETYVHISEALKNGASNAVIQRLVRQSEIRHDWIYATSGTVIDFTPIIANGSVGTIHVATKGNHYLRPTVTMVGPGSGANIIVSVNTNGKIDGMTVSGGSGYTTASTIAFSGATGTGASAKLVWPRGRTSGSLTGVTVEITNQGNSYPHPWVALPERPSTGALATATLSGLTSTPSDLNSATVTMVSNGEWYLGANAWIQISVGFGATITPTIVDGQITAIDVSGGTGYTNASVITITRPMIFSIALENNSGELQSITPNAEYNGANYILGGGVVVSGRPTGASGFVETAATISSVVNGVITGCISHQGAGETLNNDNNINLDIASTSNVGAKASAYATVTGGMVDGVVMLNHGSGYAANNTTVSFSQSNNPEFFASPYPPGDPLAPNSYFFALMHLEAFNDGVIVELHADAVRVNSAPASNDVVTLRLRDPVNNGVLWQFTGSLHDDATDDFGNSIYLPDVIQSQTDAMEIVIGGNTAIAPSSPAYGYDGNGQQQWVSSVDPVYYFSEGPSDTAFAYDDTDLYAARQSLQATNLPFGYISGGGNNAASLDSFYQALLAELAALSHLTNVPLKFDVPFDTGDPSPVATAINWIEGLNLYAGDSPHLLHAYWTPIVCQDPTGLSGRLCIGTATLNIAYACGRNARVNSNGFARKNAPVAGTNWPINRRNMQQQYFPTEQDLSALATAKINPVLFKPYATGGKFVFVDFLTMAPVTNSLRKLISVAEMACAIDQAIADYSNEIIALPMTEAIVQTKDFLKALFEGAELAAWLVPSAELNNAAFAYSVVADAQRPYDLALISYSLSYDGAVRQIIMTQTLVKR